MNALDDFSLQEYNEWLIVRVSAQSKRKGIK